MSSTPDGNAHSALVADKYQLTRLIGRGGMGSVWEATHISLGTRVAVKFIETELKESEDLRSRFENEARAAAQLQSKHVVQVFDHGVMDDGRPYIVMEYLAGEPLDARLSRVGSLPAADTARMVLQVARGLAKAHAAGIVHRDLKPENIFLVWDEEDAEDIPKIVDFGIAKFTGGSLGASSATRTGSLLGTPYYMSPEQARGLKTIDYRSDLWALGVIAFRCIVGELPFDGEAVGDLLVKICTGPIPVPSERRPGMPATFDAWMARSLARDPAERWSSAIEMAESLCEVCGLTQPRRAIVPGTGNYAQPPYGGAGSSSGSQAGFGTPSPYAGAGSSAGSQPGYAAAASLEGGTVGPLVHTAAGQGRKRRWVVPAVVFVVLGVAGASFVGMKLLGETTPPTDGPEARGGASTDQLGGASAAQSITERVIPVPEVPKASKTEPPPKTDEPKAADPEPKGQDQEGEQPADEEPAKADPVPTATRATRPAPVTATRAPTRVTRAPTRPPPPPPRATHRPPPPAATQAPPSGEIDLGY